ncbi:LacI family DNA-binding transcriptional regulator [Paenibacillaceae bacterium WGS1546]|uniref:LacI family DNA-binding transcriptional regulator n=1 Tax=Cohnella sp. WGS1546 TaxID=3366810 RepID=UPI00372D7FDA
MHCKLPTIKDIARIAKVSPATVSYVLNNTRYVSPDKVERVMKAVEEINYVPNAVARGLRVKVSKTIGLIVTDITNPFFPDLAKGCEDEAHAKGFNVVMINTNDQSERTSSALLQLRKGKLDGVIVASAKNQDGPLLEELLKQGYPIVLAHRKIPDLPVYAVVADNFKGTQSAATHLLSLGHRKIGYITGVTDSNVNYDRLGGYQQAMSDAGIPILPEWISQGHGRYEFSYQAALNIIDLPKEIRPTAIIAGNDMSALGVLDAALDKGLRVPEDLALIGVDDLFLAQSRAIQLTSVRIPRYDMGRQAARILLDLIGQKRPSPPSECILPTHLIIRRTCGAIRKTVV